MLDCRVVIYAVDSTVNIYGNEAILVLILILIDNQGTSCSKHNSYCIAI